MASAVVVPGADDQDVPVVVLGVGEQAQGDGALALVVGAGGA